MDCYTHHALRKLKGGHRAFTFTARRQGKCEKNVYTWWEFPEIVMSCADRKGAIDRHPCYSSGCCGNRYLHVHLQDGQTHHTLWVTPCSVPHGALVLQKTGLFFLQVKMYYKWIIGRKKQTQQQQQQLKNPKPKHSSLCIFSSAKLETHQINYNFSLKRFDLADFFCKTFSIVPFSNNWHLILLLTVPIRVITQKLS